ncbi:hypothetical protein [Burkholderia ambifaria]|uniref:hypothetical protein n=1 Tax=Burkholderia ambifaria TaxID=152480 RepID=UPI00158C171E|nr:hypothetical protein [Burkholderia ambifaria]
MIAIRITMRAPTEQLRQRFLPIIQQRDYFKRPVNARRGNNRYWGNAIQLLIRNA